MLTAHKEVRSHFCASTSYLDARTLEEQLEKEGFPGCREDRSVRIPKLQCRSHDLLPTARDAVAACAADLTDQAVGPCKSLATRISESLDGRPGKNACLRAVVWCPAIR